MSDLRKALEPFAKAVGCEVIEGRSFNFWTPGVTLDQIMEWCINAREALFAHPEGVEEAADRGFAGDSSGGLSNLSAAQGEMETTAEERAELATYKTSDGPWAAMAAALSRDFTRLLASLNAARRERDEAREAAYCGEEHDDGTRMKWEDKYVTANVGRFLNLHRANAAEAALDAARKAERERCAQIAMSYSTRGLRRLVADEIADAIRSEREAVRAEIIADARKA